MKTRHRGNNEGSIYQWSDGRWEAKVNLGIRNGKRWRKSFYGETRAEVAAQLTKALRDHSQGLPIAAERQKLGAFFDRWLDEAVKPSVRPLTFEQYSQHVRLYLKPALGHIELSRLGVAEVQKFVNQQLKLGWSPRTTQLHSLR